MITWPEVHVSREILYGLGIEDGGGCTRRTIKGYDCEVYLSSPHESSQVLLLAARKGERVYWFLQQIPDISEREGFGIKEDVFPQHLESKVTKTHQVPVRNLKEALKKILDVRYPIKEEILQR